MVKDTWLIIIVIALLLLHLKLTVWILMLSSLFVWVMHCLLWLMSITLFLQYHCIVTSLHELLVRFEGRSGSVRLGNRFELFTAGHYPS